MVIVVTQSESTINKTDVDFLLFAMVQIFYSTFKWIKLLCIMSILDMLHEVKTIVYALKWWTHTILILMHFIYIGGF